MEKNERKIIFYSIRISIFFGKARNCDREWGLTPYGLRMEEITLKMTKIANGKYFSFIIRSMKKKTERESYGEHL